VIPFHCSAPGYSITLFSPPGAWEFSRSEPNLPGWWLQQKVPLYPPLVPLWVVTDVGCKALSRFSHPAGKEPRPGLEVKRQARRNTTIHYPLSTDAAPDRCCEKIRREKASVEKEIASEYHSPETAAD